MTIVQAARSLAQQLKRLNLKVVFAESCTGGLVAGSLTRFPGISDHHCGGMVVYRNQTKEDYLGIAPRLLKNPGPVSEVVARQMAQRILELTPESDISAAVTGHLGPSAPADLDGVVYIAIALRRRLAKGKSAGIIALPVHRHVCATEDSRLTRQKEVVEQVLWQLAAACERDNLEVLTK